MTAATPKIIKRSVTINGHATSISIEPEFWNELQQIAQQEKLSTAALIARIDKSRGGGNLSSALRLFVLRSLKS